VARFSRLRGSSREQALRQQPPHQAGSQAEKRARSLSLGLPLIVVGWQTNTHLLVNKRRPHTNPMPKSGAPANPTPRRAHAVCMIHGSPAAPAPMGGGGGAYMFKATGQPWRYAC
jgi:hypothetical protein